MHPSYRGQRHKRSLQGRHSRPWCRYRICHRRHPQSSFGGKKTTDPRWRPHGDPRWRPHHGERGVVLRGEVPGVGGGVVRWTTKTSNYIRWFFWYGVAFLYWVIKFSKREKILTVNNRREAETHHHVHQQSQAGPFGNLLTYQGSKS